MTLSMIWYTGNQLSTLKFNIFLKSMKFFNTYKLLQLFL